MLPKPTKFGHEQYGVENVENQCTIPPVASNLNSFVLVHNGYSSKFCVFQNYPGITLMAKYAETWLYSDDSGPAYIEPLEFVPSQKGGILIPKPAIMWAPWLESSERQETLVELAEHGRIIGHPINYLDEQLGEPIGELRLELADETTRQIARTKLVAIGERFIRAKIDGARNLYLSSRILHHLDLNPGETAQVMFVAIARAFELWTINFYEEVRPDLAKTIRDHSTNFRF